MPLPSASASFDASLLTGVVSLANGGLGVSLADPGADRLLLWDDSAGTVAWLSLGTGLSITGTVLSVSGGGSGDMLAATYDPTNVAGDAFDMDNMVEGATNLILTSAERSKLAGVASGATVGATWGSNITSQPSLVSQLEAEAGVATTERMWSAERMAQAIAALETNTTYSAGSGLSLVGTSFSVDAAAVNHDSLLGFVAAEHVDHSAVSVLAGSGLTGGGTLEASRTLNVGAGTGISVAADTVSVDIAGLTEDLSPVGSVDYVMTYDASASTLKKVLMDNLPGGGGATNLDGLSDVIITSAASGDFLRYSGTSWVDSTIQPGDLPSHTHDDRYYTETESDALYALVGHNHDGSYQPLDADLTAIGEISADGFLKRSGGAWSTASLVAGDLPSHALVGPHTASGLTAGQVLRATGATTFAFQAIQASDLPSHEHDLGDLTDAGSGTGTGRIVVATSSGADTIVAPSASGQVLKSTSSGVGAGYEWGDVTTGVTSLSAGDGLDGGGTGSVTLNVNPYGGIAADRGQTVIEADAIAVVLGTTGNTAAAGNHDHSGVYQLADSDLTTIAAISTDGFLKRTGGAWASAAIAAADLPAHNLITDHTASGLTVGHVLRATGASAFAFGAIVAGDLPSHTHTLGNVQDAGSGTGAGRLVAGNASGADTIPAPSAVGQVLKAATTGLTATYEWGDVTTGVTSITAGDALDGGGTGAVTLNVNPYSGIAANRGQTAIESDAIAVVLGTTGNTAAAGNHTHSVGDVSGAVADTRNLVAGSGLTGGGTLAADRTFNVGAGTGIAVAADSVGLTGQALALHNLATSGLIARTGTGTVAGRTLTAGSGIDVTNGNGVSGNPTVAVDADVVIITVSGSAPVGSPSRAGDMHVVV